MRKSNILITTVFLLLVTNVFCQQLIWKTNINTFFDNTEYGHSKVQMPQTMAGTHLAPELGVMWDSTHYIFAGLDILHEFGSDKIIDYTDFICYYQLDKKPFRFLMGAFPRNKVLKDYSRFLIQDSVNNYRPNMNGIFWEYYKENSYFNVWLDWTSRQTRSRHEAFLMGTSLKIEKFGIYGKFAGYMFHYAGMIDPVVYEPLVDDGQFTASLGYNSSYLNNDLNVDINAGTAMSFERKRSDDVWHKPNGFLSEIKIEYRGLEVFNTYYRGDGQYKFLKEYGNKLYWGDPFYHLNSYDRTDINIHFYKSDFANIKLSYSLHFAEGEIYNQQALYVSISPDNFSKRSNKKYNYLWNDLLK